MQHLPSQNNLSVLYAERDRVRNIKYSSCVNHMWEHQKILFNAALWDLAPDGQILLPYT